MDSQHTADALVTCSKKLTDANIKDDSPPENSAYYLEICSEAQNTLNTACAHEEASFPEGLLKSCAENLKLTAQHLKAIFCKSATKYEDLKCRALQHIQNPTFKVKFDSFSARRVKCHEHVCLVFVWIPGMRSWAEIEFSDTSLTRWIDPRRPESPITS